MKSTAVSGTMLVMILIALAMTFNIRLVMASGTIYIMADGSIDPATSPILRNGHIYTFTDNIYNSIVVERDNIVIDGNGYTLQGPGMNQNMGIELRLRTNVTVQNAQIINFDRGIGVAGSSNNRISGNNINHNRWGITLGWAPLDGGYLGSSNNDISRNNIANNELAIYLFASDGNSISGNSIANNGEGIYLGYTAGGNSVYHNNFLDNDMQVVTYASMEDFWDDGYPSGGNYWSDYSTRYPDAQELDDSGIWDTPYVIDESNQDRYPLMSPWIEIVSATVDIDPDSLNLKSESVGITAYIELTAPYSPEGIDVSTVKLNGVARAEFKPSEIDDYDGDGIPDLMVKFEAAGVKPLLHAGTNKLTVTGKIYIIQFEGVDTIRVKA